jgi:hypothetical protein
MIREMQQDCCAEMPVRLYTRARDRYLSACRLVGIETELARKLREMDGFDLGRLARVHDALAARFRLTQVQGPPGITGVR